MTTKKQLIKNYKKAQKEFAQLVVPRSDTPKAIATSLMETYNNYIEWFQSVEQYAANQGWYEELTRN